MAKTYAGMGNVDDTLQYLRKAWEEGFPEIRKALQDEVFQFLAAEPRYLELLAFIEAKEQEAARPQSP